MKSLKKTLVLLVVLSMILSAVSPVFAFSDVVPEEYAEQANKMAAFGVFSGDANGNFNANDSITRAEMAKVIARLMGLTENEATANSVYASKFSDVAAGEWYTGWINLVAGKGIINGFPDGTFRPNEKVTQAQAVTMIVKALGWGVVVDQSGTWPANYITKASELKLFKDAAKTNSELVTRGNVAIYCYNALTAKTWDVAESTDGVLTSKKSSDTILAKFFSDFVNEDGQMKLVEEAYVSLSGANTTEIGKDQIKLVGTAENIEGNTVSIASFIDAEKAPKKNKEEATYKDGANVVAYVPAEVANIANLAGRKVDVIFGADNEVAYIAVTDDSYTNLYVTAWDKVEEIEIDGETYEFANDAVVAVYGHVLPYEVDCAEHDGKAEVAAVAEKACTLCGNVTRADDETDCTVDNHDGVAAAAKVEAKECTICGLAADEGTIEYTTEELVNLVIGSYVGAKDALKRNVIAEFILDGEDEIESINFKLSHDTFTAATVDGTLVVNEFIVEKISSKNALTYKGHAAHNDLDDYEDEEPRVIKNGVVAEVADIEVGDVVTEVVCDGDVEVMIVTANTVDGDVTDYLPKTNAMEIAGTEYKVIAAPLYNDEGEVDEYTTGATAEEIYEAFEDKDVTAYLNMAGEVVAVIGETEATGMILGVVTSAAEEDEDSDDVEYVKVRILAEDGSEKRYSIYNEKAGKDLANDDPARDLAKNDVIMFSADADRVIKSDDLKVLAGNESDLDFKSNSEVSVAKLSSVDDTNKKLNTKRFNASTVVINPVEEELISNWDVLMHKTTPNTFTVTGYAEANTSEAKKDKLDGTETVQYVYYVDEETPANTGYYPAKYVANTDVWVFTKDSKVVYVIAWIDEFNYGVSDDQYGIVLDVKKDKDEDDETIYVATILVDGEEETYEVSSTFRNTVEEGTFIKYDVSDGEIDSYTELAKTEMIDYIADLAGDTMKVADYDDFTTLTTTTSLKNITVKSVETADDITYIVFDNAGSTTEDLAEDYIVYDLADSTVIDEINEGDYVLLVNADSSEAGYEIVIVL